MSDSERAALLALFRSMAERRETVKLSDGYYDYVCRVCGRSNHDATNCEVMAAIEAFTPPADPPRPRAKGRRT